MRLVAWFQIIVGASIAALWVVLLAAGQVPELDAGMRGIWFHLVAELVLAGLLLGAGLSLLRRRSRGRVLKLVFPREDGRWWNPPAVSLAFRRAVKKAGVPRIRMHDLRHTHATLLLVAGQSQGRFRAARP